MSKTMNHKIEMYLRSADGVFRDFCPVELAPAKVLGPDPHPGPPWGWVCCRWKTDLFKGYNCSAWIFFEFVDHYDAFACLKKFGGGVWPYLFFQKVIFKHNYNLVRKYFDNLCYTVVFKNCLCYYTYKNNSYRNWFGWATKLRKWGQSQRQTS